MANKGIKPKSRGVAYTTPEARRARLEELQIEKLEHERSQRVWEEALVTSKILGILITAGTLFGFTLVLVHLLPSIQNSVHQIASATQQAADGISSASQNIGSFTSSSSGVLGNLTQLFSNTIAGFGISVDNVSYVLDQNSTHLENNGSVQSGFSYCTRGCNNTDYQKLYVGHVTVNASAAKGG